MATLDEVTSFLAGLSERDYQRVEASLKLRADEELTPELVLDVITPSFIGPTWQRDENGEWILPEHTLGWEIAGWCSKWLCDPNDSSKPWRFTPEQLRFVLWWYAIDEDGKFLYQSGVLQRRKGWGKDPLLAVLCLVEMVGPCRFSHWAPGGIPIGRNERAALIQVSAVSREQTTNTGDMFGLITTPAFKKEFAFKDGIELIRANQGRQKIQLVTSNYRSIEGKRATFTLLNETHHWVTGNGGIKMYETIDGNASKLAGGRYLAITNAYQPGEDSAAERMRRDHEAFLANDVDGGFLYDSVEAKSRAPIGGPLLPLVLEPMIGDSTWTKIDNVIKSIMKQSISPARSRRMWLNQVVADDDAVFTPEHIDTIEDNDLELHRGDEVVLGLDGGWTDDSTALIAIRPRDMAIFTLGIWEAPTGAEADGWRVDQQEVDEAVDRAIGLYEVAGFFSDVAYWETYIVRWTERYANDLWIKASDPSPIGFDMRGSQKRITLANERLMKAIYEGEVKFDGNLRLRRHFMNVRRRENRYGISFGKESRESKKKVDGYAALLLAFEAATEYRLKKQKKPTRKSGRSFFI